MKPVMRLLLICTAIALLVMLVWAVIWLQDKTPAGTGHAPGGRLAVGSNPALNIRFKYNTEVFHLAPFNGRAEFPLRLDATNGVKDGAFTLFGKRLGGLGQMLEKAPGPVLYDFTGQLSDSMFIESYGLTQVETPRYEDAEIAGRLALHQMLQFKRNEERAWPRYFPDAVKAGDMVYIEGWTLLTDKDLFFFYAMSPQPLTDSNRALCEQVLNSLQFDAIQARPEAPAAEAPDASAPPEGTGDGQQPPAAGQPAPATQ